MVSGLGKELLHLTPKAQSIETNIETSDLIKMKKLLLCEKLLLEDEKNLEIEEKKKKQTTHITKDHCLEYIKPQNLTVKNHTIQLENRQKIGTDISSLQIFRW